LSALVQCLVVVWSQNAALSCGNRFPTSSSPASKMWLYRLVTSKLECPSRSLTRVILSPACAR